MELRADPITPATLRRGLSHVPEEVKGLTNPKIA